jgi:HEAT repeat protein
MLSQALKDRDPSIRVLALEALALRGAEGQEALKSVLNTEDPLVRSRAAELLEQMKADEEITTTEGTE